MKYPMKEIMKKLSCSELIYQDSNIASGMVPIEIASELLQELESKLLLYFEEKELLCLT
jgi:hypothetical protein